MFQPQIVVNSLSEVHFKNINEMKTLAFFIVAFLIACATTTSDESSSSSEENDNVSSLDENASSSSEENDSFSSSNEIASSSSSIESTECKINYRYTIWIGDNVDEVQFINLSSECGIVFLNAMQQASQRREQFKFEYTTHPVFGALITQIDGVSNEEETNTYWMLYDLITAPDATNVPNDEYFEYLSPMAVSSLNVLDGHSYLFWYKTSNTAADVDQYEDYSN